MENIEFIAEVGVNHEGDLSNAKKLIVSAAAAGCDVVKFQTYKADKLASENAHSYWDLSKEATKSQNELFSKYDKFDLKDYELLSEVAKSNKIEFLTTFFDVDSIHEMQHLVNRFKVASADITNYNLIKTLAKYRKPIILSTGAATLKEIKNTVEFIEGESISDITLLHCVLRYPTEPEFAFLGRITVLKKEFPHLTIGLSDHSLASESIRIIEIALSLGVKIIEKHFTLDKNQKGNDHYHAFDANDFKEFIIKKNSLNAILNFNEEDFIASQEQAIKYARRGLYFKKDLSLGEILTEDDIVALRPANKISPTDYYNLIGLILIKDVKAGMDIERAMFSEPFNL
jgi:sialic acid synthase SpsE